MILGRAQVDMTDQYTLMICRYEKYAEEGRQEEEVIVMAALSVLLWMMYLWSLTRFQEGIYYRYRKLEEIDKSVSKVA